MTTDKELLEAAARAAGIHVWRGRLQPDLLFRNAQSGDGVVTGVEWNPLTDDGDALRLAVKLNLEFCRGLRGPKVEIAVLAMHGDICVAEFLGDDPHAATRRTIVRAAASIGQAQGDSNG